MLTSKLPFSTEESIIIHPLPDMNEVRYFKEDAFKVSNEACQIVEKFLNKDHNQRLQSPNDIEMEPFYQDFEWNKLKNGLLKPPIRPKIVLINIIFKN